MAEDSTRPTNIRPIEAADDPAVAAIIRTVMTEIGAVGEGYSIMDPEVDGMSAAYAGPRAAYYVVERSGTVVGGAGIGPLVGGAADTCELKKMYLLTEARGLGFGRRLMDLCLEAARQAGYRLCYLETLANMDDARRLYEGYGFTRLDAPMGNTGHCGCNGWYLLEL